MAICSLVLRACRAELGTSKSYLATKPQMTMSLQRAHIQLLSALRSNVCNFGASTTSDNCAALPAATSMRLRNRLRSIAPTTSKVAGVAKRSVFRRPGKFRQRRKRENCLSTNDLVTLPRYSVLRTLIDFAFQCVCHLLFIGNRVGEGLHYLLPFCFWQRHIFCILSTR